MGRMAARITDPVIHPLPPVLTGGPGSPTVLIGNLPAWRGIPLAAVAALQAAKQAADVAIQVAEAATVSAVGTPGLPAAYAAEQTTKTTVAASMSAAISGAVAASPGASMGKGTTDVHQCATPLPIPPHGPGVVIDGSATVMINGLPACRMGDTILETIGPPNKIAMGHPITFIGG